MVLPHRGIFWMKRKPRDFRARMRHRMGGRLEDALLMKKMA
jgi:hypothetical protein